MKKNIAVVGCGHWGKNLVRNFSELSALSSICDPDHLVASRFSEKYQVKNNSFTEIINDQNIKGVVLAVPARLHASMAIDVMKKGKHVFVEKPLALTEEDGKLMIEIAKKNNVQLMVGHLLHYHPIFKHIKEIVNKGQIGKLEHIQSSRLSFGKFRSEENVIWSFSPHDISMILSLANEKPKIVKCNSKSVIKKDHADIANIYIEFPSGLKSNISVSWINSYKEAKLVLTGSSALLVFDDTKPWDEKLKILPYKLEGLNQISNLKKLNEKIIKISEEEPLKNECKHFLRVIQGVSKPITNGEEGLKVLKVLSSIS